VPQAFIKDGLSWQPALRKVPFKASFRSTSLSSLEPAATSFFTFTMLSSWFVGQSAQAGSESQFAVPMQVTHEAALMMVSHACCSLHLLMAVEMQVTSCAAQVMQCNG